MDALGRLRERFVDQPPDDLTVRENERHLTSLFVAIAQLGVGLPAARLYRGA
jgi:hypothetical protein